MDGDGIKVLNGDGIKVLNGGIDCVDWKIVRRTTEMLLAFKRSVQSASWPCSPEKFANVALSRPIALLASYVAARALSSCFSI